MANKQSFCFIIAFHKFAIGKPDYLSMPKFLAGCHDNKEEISRHFKKKKDIGWSKFMATTLQPIKSWKKTGRSCEGTDFSWLSSKVSQILHLPKTM